MIFAAIWTHFLYAPVFNFLVLLYNGPAMGHLGLAVIYLTLALRIVLLPFDIISERNKGRYEAISKRIDILGKDFKNDHVAKKDMIRALLRGHKVSPWAKGLLLGFQALTLVILYQAFLGGINFKLNHLYSWVARPDFINTYFLGFDLGRRGIFWPLIVALFLFIEIYFAQRGKRGSLTRADLLYRVFFPLFCFLALYLLPSVKSIFILTTLLFSIVVSLFRKKFYRYKINIKFERPKAV